MNLPRLVLIADGFTDEAIRERTLAAADAGVPWIHLRDHEADDEAFRSAAADLTTTLRRKGIVVSVNSRIDIAKALNTDFHVGGSGPAHDTARLQLPNATIGYSAHGIEDAAIDPRPDYFFFSPVFATSSKPDYPATGLDALAAFCAAAAPTSVYALGGMTPSRIAKCLKLGARGVAVMSGILQARAPAKAAREYVSAMESSLTADKSK